MPLEKRFARSIACLITALTILTVLLYFRAKKAPAQASAQSFSHPGNFAIALAPEKNTFEQKERYAYITNYLSKHLALPVRTVLLSDYEHVCRAISNGRADAGFFGSFSYAIARARASVEPIARPLWTNDSSTYCGYLFIRKDSGIKTVEDMRGKRLALVCKTTTAGYLFPLDYFGKHGINDLEQYFSKVLFCGSHDAAAWAVYIGEAEVGACKNHIFNALKDGHPDFAEQMVVLAKSLEVPSNAMAVRADLDPAFRKRLKYLLLNMHKTQEGTKALKAFKAKRFIETTDQDYSPLYEMVEDLGIDLHTFDTKD